MDQSEQPPVNPIRGIQLTINDKTNRIEMRRLGTLNEAELLGFGSYLQNLISKDNLVPLSRSQIAVADSIKGIGQILELLGKQNDAILKKLDLCSPEPDQNQETEKSE